MVVSVLAVFASNDAADDQPGKVHTKKALSQNKQFDLANPGLLTAPRTRVACALFVETDDGEKPFVIRVNDELIKGTVKDLGWFNGQLKSFPSGNSECMMIINHLYPEMNGAIQYYSNPKFDKHRTVRIK